LPLVMSIRVSRLENFFIFQYQSRLNCRIVSLLKGMIVKDYFSNHKRSDIVATENYDLILPFLGNTSFSTSFFSLLQVFYLLTTLKIAKTWFSQLNCLADFHYYVGEISEIFSGLENFNSNSRVIVYCDSLEAIQSIN
jgi:hypothetical protein